MHTLGMQAIGRAAGKMAYAMFLWRRCKVIPGLMQPVKEKSKAPVIIMTAVVHRNGTGSDHRLEWPLAEKVRHMLREQDLTYAAI